MRLAMAPWLDKDGSSQTSALPAPVARRETTDAELCRNDGGPGGGGTGWGQEPLLSLSDAARGALAVG